MEAITHGYPKQLEVNQSEMKGSWWG